MKNADMPAGTNNLEISERYEEGHYDQVALGLTKREHFAGLAPDNIPKWFFMIWVTTPESKNEDYHWCRTSDPMDEFSCNECGLTDKGESAMYFAWRSYYADQLLKELDNE